MKSKITNQKNFNNFLKIGILISIAFLVLGILRINFSFNSAYFNGDMYSDIFYSKCSWQYHDLFPDCWVFGNQVYVFATPVIASFFYGLSGNPFIAMGIASSIMAFGVIVSFFWMTKAALKSTSLSLTALLAFLTLTLLVGDPIYDTNGWQLLFTMCSYYACYAIVAFLGFGIYINIISNWERKKAIYIILIILECVLSFCTGMNSIRQTVIMSIPLIGTEFVLVLVRICKKQKVFNIRTGLVCLISISNFLGVIAIKTIGVQMNTIYGQLELYPFHKIFEHFITEFFNVISLFGNNIPKSISLLIGILIFGYSIFVLIKSKTEEQRILILLMLLGVGIVYAISIFISLNTRNIYYFMLFPLASILIAYFFEFSNYFKFYFLRIAIVVILILTFSISFLQKIPAKKPSHYIDTEYKQVSDYLLNKNITTIYCPFNFGGKIALDSNLQIQNGFWFSTELFQKVDYICDPGIFNNSYENCAFIFTDENMKNEALLIADSKGTKLNLLYYSSKNDIWIYSSSSINLLY